MPISRLWFQIGVVLARWVVLVVALAGCAADVTDNRGEDVHRVAAESRTAHLVSIAVTPENPRIQVGSTLQFHATGRFSDGTQKDLTDSVNWKSSYTTVATISNASHSRGLATARAQGSTTMTAKHSGISGCSTLTVGPPTTATLVSIEVTPPNVSIAFGLPQPYKATGTFSDGTTQDLSAAATWNSSNTGVATIEANGVATTVGVGSTTISATLGPIAGSTALTVTAAVVLSITVIPRTHIAPGEHQQFSATANFSDGSTQFATNLTQWSSSNTSVATVSNDPDSTGVVTGVAVGATTICGTFSSVTGCTTLDVTDNRLVSLAISPTQAVSPLNTRFQFTASGVFADGTTEDLTARATWTCSDLSVASIGTGQFAPGLTFPISVGTTTITAAAGQLTTSATLHVTAAATSRSQ